MKTEPRSAIHMEKPLLTAWWACKLSRVELHGFIRVEPTMLARLMESQILHQPAGSVSRALRKGTMVSARLSVWEKTVSQLSS